MKVRRVFEHRIAGHLPSLTLSEAGVDHPTAWGDTVLAGLSDKHPVSQKTAVHQINPLICGDLAHDRVAGWRTEDVERY
jgi:hypothetical protein